jgi:hypothetical protein
MLLISQSARVLANHRRLRRKQPHSLTQSADRALYAKLATALFLKALRQVVDSTVGDVVQLVRTLPFPCPLSRAVLFFLFFRR